jgi:hypothetical protein
MCEVLCYNLRMLYPFEARITKGAYQMRCSPEYLTYRKTGLANWPWCLCILVIFASTVHSDAYDLGERKCGGEYGGLNLQYSRSMHSFTDVDKLISSMPWTKKEYPVLSQKRVTSVYQEVMDTFSRHDAGGETYDVYVPIGSEQFIAEDFVRVGIISKATFANGACGGAEVSYAYIPQTVGDLINSRNFVDYVSGVLKNFIHVGGANGLVNEGPLNLSPVEPYYPTKRFTVAVPSELSRGSDARGTWDRFDIVFALYQKTAKDFLVVIHAEDLRTAPKLASHTTPPSVEHFRRLGDDQYGAEYIVAAGLANYMTGSPSLCKVLAEGFDAAEEGPFRCTHP